jgi:hypothetical protein
MGAIERQVLQVKRKNSTNWSPPEARRTVVGSVAWSSGPREVAAGRAVASAGVGEAEVRGVGVREAGGEVRGFVGVGGEFVGEAAGVQAVRKTASRLALSKIEGTRLRKKRIFIICL